MSESIGFADTSPVSQRERPGASVSTAVTSPQLGVDSLGGVASAYPQEDESLDDVGVSRKRKRATAGGRRTASGRGSTIERQKITRACDACKARKSRCSGTLPCHRCSQTSIPCRYDSPHKRGQPPSPPRAPLLSPDSPATWLGGQPQQPQPTQQVAASGSTFAVPPSESLQPEPAVHVLQSSHSSPGRDATSVEGQYIGPTSGLAFLQRVKGRLRQDFSSSSRTGGDTPCGPSSIFTFGDKPYPNYPSTALNLPTRQQAREHVKRYFEFAVPTYRFLHQGTVEGWLEKFMDENDPSGNGTKLLTDGKAAVVLMVLATSTLYRVDDTAALHDAEAEEYDQSGILAAAAERRLSTETGPPRLESVQARLAQCLYLMGSSRTNQAWYLFGTTAQLILSLGLHSQKHSRMSQTGNGLIESECRKRVFWSAYTLDKYFNIIMGRPGIFRDEDIDQQLPSRLNDSELGMEKGRSRSVWHQCIMDAPVYHFKLSRIISGICNDIYSIHPKSPEDLLTHAEQRTAELKGWKDGLPAFLEPTKVDPSILVPIFQRQSTVLTLAYAHALILANRQFLLSNFVDLTRPTSSADQRVELRIQECIEAALVVVNTVNNFVENGTLYRTFWFSQYISFCAIETLYVYAIRGYQTQRAAAEQMDTSNATLIPKRGYMEYFEAAEECRTLIARKTESNSPSRRYSIILDELKRQVLAEIKGASTSINNQAARRPFGPHEASTFNEEQSSAVGDHLRLVQDDILSQDLFPNRQSEYLDSYMSSTMSLGPPGASSSTTGIPLLADTTLDSQNLGLPFDIVGWPELDSWAMTWPDTNNTGFDF